MPWITSFDSDLGGETHRRPRWKELNRHSDRRRRFGHAWNWRRQHPCFLHPPFLQPQHSDIQTARMRSQRTGKSAPSSRFPANMDTFEHVKAYFVCRMDPHT